MSAEQLPDAPLAGLRILFLHGIGAPAPNSFERRVHLETLRAAGATVLCPNLHTSKTKWREKHSVVRHLMRQPLLWALTALATVVPLAAAYQFNSAAHGGASVAIFLGSFMAMPKIKKRLLRGALDSALGATRAAARDALKAAWDGGGVDVCVGYSWGGALAVVLAAEDEWAWRGPTLLVAPAVDKLLKPSPRWRAAADLRRCGAHAASRVRVLQGANDGIVAAKGVVRWATDHKLSVKTLPAARHELGRTEEERRELVDAVAALAKAARGASEKEREGWLGPGARTVPAERARAALADAM